jgi:hypothetical protein
METFNFGGLTLGGEGSAIGKQTCDNCGNPGDLNCPIRDIAHYCAYDCQIKAWAKHEADCTGGQASPMPPPPTTKNMGAVRGIIFASGEFGLTQIRYIRHYPGYVSIDLGGTLAMPGENTESGVYEAPMWFDITHSTISKQDALPYTFRPHGRDDLSRNNYVTGSDGYESENNEMAEKHEMDSEINIAIQKLKQTDDYAHAWKEPVIANSVKELTADSHPMELVDVSSEGSGDLLHPMNFFCGIRDPVEMISCVRVNCENDVRDHG